jgi:hypothetical protein
MHAFIFWGFCVIAIRTITLFAQILRVHLSLRTAPRNIYNFTKISSRVLVNIASSLYSAA